MPEKVFRRMQQTEHTLNPEERVQRPAHHRTCHASLLHLSCAVGVLAGTLNHSAATCFTRVLGNQLETCPTSLKPGASRPPLTHKTKDRIWITILSAKVMDVVEANRLQNFSLKPFKLQKSAVCVRKTLVNIKSKIKLTAELLLLLLNIWTVACIAVNQLLA